MIVQLNQFDITVAQLHHFATGGFWANLPRFCPSRPAVKLLLVSDTLNPQHIHDGFLETATPEAALTPSLRAYRVQYDDYLAQMAREVRFMRVYLSLDSYLTETSLCQLLATYNISASPLAQAVPRPFERGVDKWGHTLAEDGGYWRVLRSKTVQHGSVFVRVLHRLFELEFPIFAALNFDTFPPSAANDILRRKGLAVRYSKAKDDALAEAQSVAASIGGMRGEMSRYGTAMHTASLLVLIGADTLPKLRERTDIVRGALPSVSMDIAQPQAQLITDMFSATPMPSAGGALLTTPGVALLAGSALSYRRRTETRGVLLGIDQHQSPVVFNFFDHRAPSYNAVVLGQTGKGKTFAVLTMMLCHMLLGVRSIILDPQGNVDLRFLGDKAYHRSRLGTDQASINILDITRDALVTQVTSVKHILTLLNVLPPGDATADALLDEVLMDIYRPLWGVRGQLRLGQMPTLGAVQARATAIAQDGGRMAAARQAAQQIAYQLTPYVSGSLSSLFGRATSVDFAMKRDLTVYDVSRLPDQATGGNLRAVLLAILVADINQHIRRLRQAGDTTPILFFVDEMGVLMRDAVIASYVSAEYKTARSRLVGMIVADQDLPSLLGPSDATGLHHGEPMLANAAYRFIFMQPDDQLSHIRERFPNLPPALVNRLPSLPRGTCITQFPDDLLVVSVEASPLEAIVLSSRPQDQARAEQIRQQLLAELGEGVR